MIIAGNAGNVKQRGFRRLCRAARRMRTEASLPSMQIRLCIPFAGIGLRESAERLGAGSEPVGGVNGCAARTGRKKMAEEKPMPDLRCRKCLVREMADEDLKNKIAQLIEDVPEEGRTDPAEYEKRLAACRACEKLLAGTCRICGCFVEGRAAVEMLHCPMPGNPRW